ncbi:MAG: peroxiredoxin [Vulcanimicrobiaceae bacterium]
MARFIAVAIITIIAVLGILALGRHAARAALSPGERAPLFSAEASMGDRVFIFSLQNELKKGPVVLYFFPAAFTTGCTQEAHDFADAIEKYKALHATVIGISKDNIQKLHDFGTSECRSKFPVASDADLSIARSYDAVIDFHKNLYANRVSYVISRNDRIAYSYSSLDPDKHVENTLAALQRLAEK